MFWENFYINIYVYQTFENVNLKYLWFIILLLYYSKIQKIILRDCTLLHVGQREKKQKVHRHFLMNNSIILCRIVGKNIIMFYFFKIIKYIFHAYFQDFVLLHILTKQNCQTT